MCGKNLDLSKATIKLMKQGDAKQSHHFAKDSARPNSLTDVSMGTS